MVLSLLGFPGMARWATEAPPGLPLIPPLISASLRPPPPPALPHTPPCRRAVGAVHAGRMGLWLTIPHPLLPLPRAAGPSAPCAPAAWACG